MLISTSRKPSQKTRKFCKNLSHAFDYDYVNRGKEWAENVVADYPENRQVTVFYKPDKPEFSVLERGTTASAYIPIYFGYVSIALAVIYFIFRLIWSIWRK